MTEQHAEKVALDSPGCPAATDFRTDSGMVLITRCLKSAGHVGKHSDRRSKTWRDGQTTWWVLPPGCRQNDQTGGSERRTSPESREASDG